MMKTNANTSSVQCVEFQLAATHGPSADQTLTVRPTLPRIRDPLAGEGSPCDSRHDVKVSTTVAVSRPESEQAELTDRSHLSAVHTAASAKCLAGECAATRPELVAPMAAGTAASSSCALLEGEVWKLSTAVKLNDRSEGTASAERIQGGGAMRVDFWLTSVVKW